MSTPTDSPRTRSFYSEPMIVIPAIAIAVALMVAVDWLITTLGTRIMEPLVTSGASATAQGTTVYLLGFALPVSLSVLVYWLSDRQGVGSNRQLLIRVLGAGVMVSSISVLNAAEAALSPEAWASTQTLVIRSAIVLVVGAIGWALIKLVTWLVRDELRARDASTTDESASNRPA